MTDEDILKKMQDDLKNTKEIIEQCTKYIYTTYKPVTISLEKKTFEITKKEIKDLLVNFF